MSKKEDKAGQEGEEAGKKVKGGKSNLVPAIVVALGLIVGGFLMGRGGGGHAVEAATPVHAPPTTVATGGVAMLEPVTMNLADGRYLKVTLGLELKKGGDPKAFLGTGKSAVALDLAIQQLSHHTSADLQPPDRRSEVKRHLAETVVEAFGGDVLHLYFTEWVVQ